MLQRDFDLVIQHPIEANEISVLPKNARRLGAIRPAPRHKEDINVSCRIARDQQLIPVAMMPEGAILFRLIGSNNKKEIGCNLNGHFACRGEYDVGLCSEPSSQCA